MASDNYFHYVTQLIQRLDFISRLKKRILKKIHIASEKIINRLTMANTIKQNSAKGYMFLQSVNFQRSIFRT